MGGREADAREVAGRDSLPELSARVDPDVRGSGAKSSRIMMAILQRLTAETYLLHDPGAGTPRQRWQHFLAFMTPRGATPPRAAWTTCRRFSRRKSRAPLGAAWRVWAGRATRGPAFPGEFRDEGFAD